MSFLRDYQEFATGNECPAIYHTWCGMSALSSLASRRFWVDQGFFTVYPNLYIILVGDPGIKKTTGMKLARKLIQQFPHIPVAPASITKEAITQHMAEKGSPCQKVFSYEGHRKDYTHLTIFCNEIVSLLSAGGNPIGMIDFLTDIWDQDVFEVKTKNKGRDLVKGPFITILACMTPETTKNLLNQSIISGGFSRRCMFVMAHRNEKPVARPQLTKEQTDAWDRCIQRANEIQKMSGKFQWSPEAETFFDEWYDKNFWQTEQTDDIVMQGFYRSKGEYVLKIAMLVSLSEKNELILTKADIEAALHFIEQVEPEVSTVFAGTGRNEMAPIANAMLLLVKEKGKMDVKRLYAAFYAQASMDEMNEVIRFLVNQKKVKLTEEKDSNSKPVTSIEIAQSGI